MYVLTRPLFTMNVSFRGEQRTRVNEGSGLLTASELLVLENHEAGSGRELAMAHHILEDTLEENR